MEFSKIFKMFYIALILFFSLLSSLFSQWYKVSSVIDSETLNDIIIINDSLIISVGDIGTIKRSTDFGISWNTVRGHYSFNDLTGIAFNNAVTMACGKHSEILKSLDYGLTWQKVNINEDGNLNSIALRDGFGLIVGNDGKIYKIEGNYENIRIIDVGKTNCLNDVIIINDSLCFIVGNSGLILRSDDAGENWYNVESNTKSDLYCITKGINNELIIGGKKSVIIKSRDNYNSFSNEIEGKYNGLFNDIVYIKDSIIVAGFMEQDGIGKQSFSLDYGNTFTFSFLTVNPNNSFCYSPNKETGFCCGLQGSIAKYKPDRDLKKDNFWGFLDKSTSGPEKFNKKRISGISETVLTSNSESKVYISIDSGLVFKEIYERHNQRCSIKNSIFLNDKTILIIEDSTVMVNDGNRTYVKYYPSITKLNINDSTYSRIYFYSDTTGLNEFAYNNSDYIVSFEKFKKLFYISEDEATSWAKIESPPIYDLSVIDKNIIYIITNNNLTYYLHKTLNNCKSWDTLKLNIVGEGQVKLFFINNDTGWFLLSNRLNNKNNKIYKTDDGGNTWQLQFDKLYPASIGIQDIKFIDENYGLACGNMGLLLETSNGGETWSESLYKDSFYLDTYCELYYPSRKVAYIADENDVYRNIFDTLQNSMENEHFEDLTEIKCYPNPANNKVKIIFQNSSFNDLSVEIYDALGRQVFLIHSIDDNEIVLDLEGLSNGTYLVVLRSPKGVSTSKIYIIR